MRYLAALLTLAVSLPAQSWMGTTTGYVYFGFTGFGSNGPNIFTTALSTDGTTWSTQAGGQWFDYLTVANSGTRVPYQINAPDVAWINGQWCGHTATANDANLDLYPWIIACANATTGVFSTIASINWSGSIASLTACYSGGWARNEDGSIYVDGSGNVHLYVPCSASGLTSFKIYETHSQATDLVTWTSPVDTQINQTDTIDPEVYLVAGTFYMWCKKDDTEFITLASASSATGTFTMLETGNWAGWGSGLEGPFVYKNPSNNGWILMMEAYATTHQMYYSTCNTQSFTACTWSAKQLWTESAFYRHGNVVFLGN